MKVTRTGFGSPVIAILGGLHGNEKIGVEVIEKFLELSIKASVKCIVAHESALNLNQRFVESDLNRLFPGKANGSKEEKLAYDILKEIADADYVFDIHSTTADTEDFIITVGESELAKYFPLRRVVDMAGFAKGGSLIEHVPRGISLEYNKTTSADEIVKQLRRCLVNLGEGSSNLFPQEHYQVYGVLEKKHAVNQNIILKNFVETELNGEKFIPILYGEEAYSIILCLKARQVKISKG